MLKHIAILIFIIFGTVLFKMNKKESIIMKQTHFPKLSDRLLPQEFGLLKILSYDIGNTALRNNYQTWLKNQGDLKRADFLENYSAFIQNMRFEEAPDTTQMDQEWLNLIGVPLLYGLAEDSAGQFKDIVCDLARPALNITKIESNDNEILIGSTKFGGLPDLPSNFIWPKGKDCKEYYSSPTDNIEEYAGFVGQINLSDFKKTVVEDRIRTEGLISIFCYQVYKSDNVDIVGIKLYYFDETTQLTRTKPRVDLKLGNEIIEDVVKVRFTENLHLPDQSNPLGDKLPKDSEDYDSFSEYYHQENSDLFLGYYEMTEAYEDPTPDSSFQNLLSIVNQVNHELTIQIPIEDLKKGIVDNAILSWVCFDN